MKKKVKCVTTIAQREILGNLFIIRELTGAFLVVVGAENYFNEDPVGG